MKTERRPLSLYLHIPFCVRKCLYCDFLSGPRTKEEQERYLSCLIREIRREADAYKDCLVETVFVGGGTPSLLAPEWMERILLTVSGSYHLAKDCEITIEANPGTAPKPKLCSLFRMGVNRLSIGLQSAVDEELAALGRIHTFSDFLATYEAAAEAGFTNINVDLMSGIPLQSAESWTKTLERALSLEPAHISAYSLIIEEGTYFYEHRPSLPDEETDRLLYRMTNEMLGAHGYHRYEISNYAREGFECRHNLVYWRRGEYAGFGLGAASLVGNTRYRNCEDFDAYIGREGDCRQEENVLSVPEQMEEFMFLGLRLTRGVSNLDFRKAFGRTIQEVYPGITEGLIGQGLLCRDKGEGDERFFLSERGLDVSNRVMAEFLF